MIKSTIKLGCDLRNRKKEAIVLIELQETVTEIDGKKNFNIIDYAVNDDDARTMINSKPYSQTPEQIDAIDAYLEANNDFSGMTKTQKESLKLKLGLLYFVKNDFVDEEQTELIYGSVPSNWELV